MSGSAGVPVYAQRMEPPISELCRSWWSCAASEAVWELWLFVSMGALAFALFVVLVHLQRARSVVVEERRRSVVEKEAFQSFAKRVREVPAAATTPYPLAGGVVSSTNAETSLQPLEKIKGAYRQTVMTVPHYEQEYDETLAENMTIEFGQDIADAVSNSAQLSPILKQLLVSKATHSAENRMRLIRSLDREMDSLKAAARAFDSIESQLDACDPDALATEPYPQLMNWWTRLDSLEARCAKALRARQDEIHHEPLNTPRLNGGPPLPEYVYQQLPVDYPVLVAGGTVLEQIQRNRSLLIEEVCSRA